MKLSNTMLINISKQIESGRAITAIATANHYLKKDCSLRKALVKKAQGKLVHVNKATLSILAGEALDLETYRKAIESSNQYVVKKQIRLVVPTRYNLHRSRKNRREVPARRSFISYP